MNRNHTFNNWLKIFCCQLFWFISWSVTQHETRRTISHLFKHNGSHMHHQLYLIPCSPKAPFLIALQLANLCEEVLLWLFPFIPLFCVIFTLVELPGSPLWPCTNGSLHDTMEQSGHLASLLPPSPTLHPPLQPPSTMASVTKGSIEDFGATRVTRKHSDTHTDAVVTSHSLTLKQFSSQMMPGTLSPSLYSKAVTGLTSNTDPLWPKHSSADHGKWNLAWHL